MASVLKKRRMRSRKMSKVSKYEPYYRKSVRTDSAINSLVNYGKTGRLMPPTLMVDHKYIFSGAASVLSLVTINTKVAASILYKPNTSITDADV